MTCLVGVLNKKGAAIASDSAVTVVGGKQISYYSSATKMVRLCDNPPVSIMVGCDGSFLGVPWRIMADIFRKRNGDCKYGSIKDALFQFFSFISENKESFIRKNSVDHFILCAIDFLADCTNLHGNDTKAGSFKKESKRVEKMINSLHPLETSEYPNLKERIQEVYDKHKRNTVLYEHVTSQEERKLLNMTEAFLSREHDVLDSFTKLIVCGYGSEDLYPSILSVKVYGGYDGVILYSKSQLESIDEDNPSMIRPFIATYAIDSVLSGIMSFKFDIEDIVARSLAGYGQGVYFKLEEKSDEIMQSLEKVKSKDLVERYKKMVQKESEKRMKQWEKEIVDFNLSQLAYLAKDLVSLQCFDLRLYGEDPRVHEPIKVDVHSR